MKQTVAIAGAICAILYSDSGSDPPAPQRVTQLSSTQETPAKGKNSLASQDNARPSPRATPSTAVVSFKDGLLTIVAQDVKLRDILDQVREATGAAVQAPALNELVTAHLGPRPPAQVIAALLKGSRASYVIVDAAGSGKIQAIEVLREPWAEAGRGSRQPAADAKISVASETEAVREKALLVGQTGGDEGVWDDVDVGTLLNPVASAPVTASRPVQRPRSRSSVLSDSPAPE
jgi:hypothetical protein